MEEAEKLCDRVAIIDQGRLIALDTPKNLIKNLDAENKIMFTVTKDFPPSTLENVTEVTRVEVMERIVMVYGKGSELLTEVIKRLNANKLEFSDLKLTNANLEDVFLTLTGKAIQDNGGLK